MPEPLEGGGETGSSDRAPEPPVRRQLWLLGARLAVATLLLGASLLALGGGASSFTGGAIMALIAATFATGLGVAIALPRVTAPRALAALQVAWDLCLVTGLVYLLGGAGSGFSFLYGVIILAAALTVGPRAAQLTTATALTLFVVVALGLANDWLPAPPDSVLDHELSPDELALSVLRNVVGFILVGVLATALAERLREAGGQLQRATRSAAELSRLNENILRSLSSGLLTTDLSGRVGRINPAGAKLLGAELGEIEGRDASELLPVDPALEEDRYVERGEGTAERLDGERFPVGFSCSPLRDAQERLLGTLVLFQDLTELKQLQEKAERAERLAALGRLSAGLAHEIRNPLGSISGSVEMVREAPELSEEDRHLLSLVLSEVDRLNGLVTTMLDVGRPRKPEPASVDLGALARDVASVMRREAEAELEVREPAEAVLVQADPGQVRQVLWNLIKNAVQFSPPGAPVRVRVDLDAGGRPRLSVTDEGPGVPPEDRDRLFEMFFSKRRHGVGLGLALVHQIVEAHGGTIEVDSEPGEGATFTVTLPPRPATRASQPAPAR